MSPIPPKLERTLPLVDQQLAARKELADKGYFSRLKLLEYEQLRVEHIQNLEVQRANAARAQAAIAEADAQLAELRGTFGRTAGGELSESQAKSALARQDVTRSQRRQEYQALRAPVSGTVQQLAISTVGGVVQPAQPLMVIVPDDATPEVEVMILNKDIGFVREGQKVRVKLEAYPFTDFGVVPGVVDSISRDAIDRGMQDGPVPSPSERRPEQGLVYAARVRLLHGNVQVGAKPEHIGPGLAVQAEIVTGRRTVISYLLSPISRTFDEAGKER